MAQPKPHKFPEKLEKGEFYLPATTRKNLGAHLEQFTANLGLLLNKYIWRTVFEGTGTKPAWFQNISPFYAGDAKLIEQVRERRRAMLQSLGAHLLKKKLAWRMVVGLGGETVLETDLTLHHTYGFPIIPGSALKGLTRAFVTTEKTEYRPQEEQDHPTIQRIFGTQDQAGTVCFYDAYPEGSVTYALDIMNPHYGQYYGTSSSTEEQTPPANNQQPIPVTFLTVASTSFLFALKARTASAEDDLQLAMGWLREALSTHGIGGKTSSGYGYFKTEDEKVEEAPPTPVIDSVAMIPAQPILTKIRDIRTPEKLSEYIEGLCSQWKKLEDLQVRILVAKEILSCLNTYTTPRLHKRINPMSWFKAFLAFAQEHHLTDDQ